jgi:hypothetical protein
LFQVDRRIFAAPLVQDWSVHLLRRVVDEIEGQVVPMVDRVERVFGVRQREVPFVG